MKRKVCKALSVFLSVAALCTTAYARDIDPKQWEDLNLVSIPVTMSYDGTFTDRVELYVDGVQTTALWYDESRDNNGYDGILSVEPGTHKLAVLSSTDIADVYTFDYPEMIDTNKDKKISIRAKVNEAAEDGNYSGHDGDEETAAEAEFLIPSQYDFSNGAEAGAIHISAKNYGAVKSLTFHLVGGDQRYDIVLDREHVFEADVILPVGEYYESSSIEVELSDAASVRDDVTYAWVHKNNPTFFGNYYTVSKDSVVNIDDLIVYMVQGNEQTELNSDILFADSNEKNLVQAQQSHQQEELESVFPEIYETTQAPTETIATAEPVEEKSSGIKDVLIPAVSVVWVICLVAGTIYLIRKKKER